MSGTQPGIRILWPDSARADYDGPCPNCGAAGPKSHVLEVAWVAPKLPLGDRKPVFACPHCEARFYPPLSVPNYHDPDVMDWGWHQFHIQQGAGLVPITETIGRIARPAGTKFLEIGCGYGFGLDFAIHALGWRGIGIDPSPMARLGAADLGVTIRDGYFPDSDPQAGLWDVIAATEVIEHVAHPADLLAALRARLAPDGILLLTTPDGAAIERATPEAALVQLLAPGIHMVFQTEASLRRLLDGGGFPDAVIGRDGLTLVAYAGAIQGALVDHAGEQRRRFRAYLATRAGQVPAGSDLGLGFAGRAMFEAAIDLDWPACRLIRTGLWSAIRQRFGIDLDHLAELPAALAAMALPALNDAMPLNLGMILYAEASRLRADPALRPRAGPMFALAGRAAAALHAALARATLNDGLAEELIWRGAAEAAIESARVAAPDTIGRFACLHDLGIADPERRAIAWRGVVELTNQGAIDAARQLIRSESLSNRLDDLPAGIGRDARIAVGQLALAAGGDPAEALAMADALGERDAASADLLLGGFVRLVNRAEFAAVATRVGAVSALCIGRHDAAGQDGQNALAQVIAHCADPAAIPALLRPLAIDPGRRCEIMLEAFCRLVDAGRYDAAAAMADAENIVSHAVARQDQAGRDARLALALLDLASGDPMDVPARLTGLDIEASRRREIMVGAFSRLVNTARYREALDFAASHAIERLAGADQAGRDANIGLAILDLIAGDPADAPRRIAAIEIDDQRRRQITLGAFVTLVNRGRYEDAGTLRATAPIDHWAAPDADNAPCDADAADATRSIAVLDLVQGDPVALPALIRTLDIAPEDIPPLAINGFSKLVNAGRYAEAADLATTLGLDPTSPSLTAAQRTDLWLGRTVIELAIGDAALVEPHLRQFDLPSAERAVLLLSAFVRLVNESRYPAAAAIAELHPILPMIEGADGALASDAVVARAMIELAIGDPARVPGLIADFSIPARKSRDLIATAFIRLINAARYDEAAAIAAAHDIAAIAAASTGDLGADIALSRARLDLVLGDPQAAPARLLGHQLPSARQAEIILGTLIRLVNRADYPAARTLLADRAIDDDIAIATEEDRNDAIHAMIALELTDGDPGRVISLIARFPSLAGSARDTALAEAFVRLMNAGRIAEATMTMATGDWVDRLDHLGEPLGTDCCGALIRYDLRDPEGMHRIPARLDALIARGGSAGDVEALIEAAFTAAMGSGDRDMAARLYPQLTRQPGPFTVARSDAERGFFYACGVYLLGISPAQPHRAELGFSAVRRGTIAGLEPGSQADGLFWESLRGEMIALHATDRAAEADALVRTMQARYQGSPADLLNTKSTATQDQDRCGSVNSTTR